MDTLIGVVLLLLASGLLLSLGGTALFFWRLRRTLTRACDDTGNPITGQSPPNYSAPCPVCVEVHDPRPCPRLMQDGNPTYGMIPCHGCCNFRNPGEPCPWLGCRSHNPPHVSRPAREVFGPSARARQRIGLALLLLISSTAPAWAVCISGQEGRDQQVDPLPAYPASTGGCSAEPQAPGEGAVPVVVVGLAVLVGLVLRRRLWIAVLLLLTTGPAWAYARVGANHGDRYAPQTMTTPRDPPAPKEATSPGVQHRYGGQPDVGPTPPDRLVPPKAAQPSLPWKSAAVAVLLLLTFGWYARMRWWGGVLRVRGQRIMHRATTAGPAWTRQSWSLPVMHRTLIGAIWAALRGLPVLLLLLCAPVWAQPSAAYQAGVIASTSGIFDPALDRPQPSPEPEKHMGSERPRAASSNEPAPRWPWALLGGLLSALIWLPLGAWVRPNSPRSSRTICTT